MTLPVTADAVRDAARAIAGTVLETPAARSITLSEITGADVVVKFENLQFTGSYKERGALNKLLTLSAEERRRGVVAMSAGNHAQAVAHHGARLGIPVTIVMPSFTPFVKVARTEDLGAEVVLHGDDLEGSAAEARRIEREQGRVFVAPYDDVAVIAGAGTVAFELLRQQPELDTLVIPVGGGGLISGCAVIAADIRPDVQVIGVQTDRYPSMIAALAGHEPRCLGPTIAEGIAVPRAGTLTAAILRELGVPVFSVSEGSIEASVALLLEIEKTVVEGAGAAGLALLLEQRERFAGRRVGLVLTGGNIDLRILSSVIMRGMLRTGRLIRLEIDIADIPGALAQVSGSIGELGGNIVDVAHQRLFSDVSVKSAVLEVAVETRDRDHGEKIVTALRAAGYTVTIASDRHSH